MFEFCGSNTHFRDSVKGIRYHLILLKFSQ